MDYEYGTEAFAGIPAWITELIIPIAFGMMAFRYFLLFLSPPRSKNR
jgi:TRAP-type C4-dicarboxylate transport system permease small subunit